jgi:hypothetical protein
MLASAASIFDSRRSGSNDIVEGCVTWAMEGGEAAVLHYLGNLSGELTGTSLPDHEAFIVSSKSSPSVMA